MAIFSELTPILRALRLPSVFERDASQSKWRRFLGVGVLIGGVAILLRGTGFQAASASLVLAGASLFVGVLVGFLFGIPKTVRRTPETTTAGTLTEGDYQPNTNLEEISDWLTKMLVGIGLVQLTRVPDLLQSIAAYWAPSFGAAAPKQFAAGVIVYFAAIGFLLGYLWTRLALVGDFIENDPRRVISNLLARVVASAGKDPTLTERSADREVVTSEQVDAAQALQEISTQGGVSFAEMRRQIEALAKQYEAVRATMRSGPDRTRRMEVIATKMRAFALAAYQALPELAKSNVAGERLAAVTFLQTQPSRDYYDWLAERLRVERPFIGYHAAVALRNAARAVPEGDRQALKSAVSRALEYTSGLSEATDRVSVLNAALKILNGS